MVRLGSIGILDGMVVETVGVVERGALKHLYDDVL